jgi:HAD superfamily hydrolase (TIGR01490 family)|uniref:HAD-IB family hydrolase n=1 Tax=Desulfobacca acetoxidans TaxID=60893 RepID=A0A7V6A0Y6_9BACT
MKAAAIFDVDGTLVQGGTERLFFRYLVQTGKLSLPRAFGFLARLAAAPGERFCNKSYLAGVSVAEMEHLGRRCFEEVILPRLRPAAVARLQAHRSGGRKIILLTGSLTFLMLPLQKHLDADWLIATELMQVNGRFTGAISGMHPRGENKRLLLEKLAHSQGLDLACSSAYGNHEEDIPLLGSVGHPVAVSPTRALKRLARERGWPVEYF